MDALIIIKPKTYFHSRILFISYILTSILLFVRPLILYNGCLLSQKKNKTNILLHNKQNKLIQTNTLIKKQCLRL